MSQLLNFWEGELPADLRAPGEPYVALVTHERGNTGTLNVRSFYLSPSRLSERTIPPEIARLDPIHRFEALRWNNLVDGFVSSLEELHYPPLFDGGAQRSDAVVRRVPPRPQVVDAQTLAGLRGRHDWRELARWPQGWRFILQLGPRAASLLPYSAMADPLEDPEARSAGLDTLLAILRKSTTPQTPVLLFDAIWSLTEGEMTLVDLLAHSGSDIRTEPFAERARLLEQEVNELRGNGLSAMVRSWSELAVGSPSCMAANESAYGEDLVTDGGSA